MPALDLIAAPELDSWSLLGLELNLLDAQASRTAPPTLVLYTTAGRGVSIGRHHLYGGSGESGGIRVLRRLAGGRAVGAGDGWFGLALMLPARDGLLRDARAPLKPEQVMNRCVRGLLAGMKSLGLECFYPGRDAVTLNGREIAMCTFEIDSSSALLFEVALAAARGMEAVARDLECVDPGGLITCPMYTADHATTVGRELGRELGFAQIADVVAGGYKSTLGEVRRRELDSAMHDAAHRRGERLRASGWLNCVAADPMLTLSNRIATQLGATEIRIAPAPDGSVKRAQLTGDFIANSGGIARFERALQGKMLDLASVGRTVTEVFGSNDNFILGIGELANLTRLVASAA